MTELFARLRAQRRAAPATSVRSIDMAAEIDLRAVLPSIDVPTLIVHHAGDPMVVVDHGRYLAEHIPGARYVELPDADHVTIAEDAPDAFDEIGEFLTGVRAPATHDRLLATVMFTDIVGSTARRGESATSRWRAIARPPRRCSCAELRRASRAARSRPPATASSATFDGPARAVQCAVATIEAVGTLGIDSGRCPHR